MRKVIVGEKVPSKLERLAQKVEAATTTKSTFGSPSENAVLPRRSRMARLLDRAAIQKLLGQTVRDPTGRTYLVAKDGSLRLTGRTFPKGHAGKVLRKKFHKMRACHSLGKRVSA